MDLKGWINKLVHLLGQYRYALLILVIGAGLMLLPGIPESAADPVDVPATPAIDLTPEQKLESILSAVRGAGKVQVLLSRAEGEKTTYQTDTDTSTDADSSSHRSHTVTVTDQNRNQTGLVVQIDPPVYLGAIIVCQGADDPAVRLAIVDAVSKYTGLGANQISVLKMK